jgi:hypothetical protein
VVRREPDVSEEHSCEVKQEISSSRWQVELAYSLILRMEATFLRNVGLSELYGITAQKYTLFAGTAVRTSNASGILKFVA